ncbi:MAG TPA: MFS transporter, partial [Candidatus Thermoplasmatota archaeon]|nr:MFS transporter [Candidatus Thermoplasmatota archaeon]
RVPRRVMATLAGVIFLRVLGVSLLFAGFAAHGVSLGGTTLQASLAFAAYPFALAAFMLPLAALSDRVGRRPVMLGALAVSALGGIGAALADDVHALTFWRLVQGAGAVNGVALALAGETGAPEGRTTRMAVLGVAAGGGFAVGVLVGAWLTPLVGVPGLLLGHSVLSLAMLWPVARVVPASAVAPAATGARVWDPRILTLGVAAFAVNLALTGLLFLSPLLVHDVPYALAMTLMVLPAGAGMFVASRLADRGHARAVGATGGALLALAPLAFLFPTSAPALVVAGMLFFIGHSALTALLPSLASARAPEGRRGFAQGVQSTLQYLGSAVGAGVVGALHPRVAPLALVFLLAGALVAAAVARATAR